MQEADVELRADHPISAQWQRHSWLDGIVMGLLGVEYWRQTLTEYAYLIQVRQLSTKGCNDMVKSAAIVPMR